MMKLGKRQRKDNVQWVQTALQVTTDSASGKRTASKLRATLVADRTANTLQGNLVNMVHGSSNLQTDCWKGLPECLNVMFRNMS